MDQLNRVLTSLGVVDVKSLLELLGRVGAFALFQIEQPSITLRRLEFRVVRAVRDELNQDIAFVSAYCVCVGLSPHGAVA